MIRRLAWRLLVSGAFLAAGSGLLGFAGGRWLHASSPATVAPSAFAEPRTCVLCPPGMQLDAVEVQQRRGSVLFVLHGRWPPSVDAFGAGICLTVNGGDITLAPHGSRGAFEVTPASASADVATALQGDALLIDLRGPAQPVAPVRFHVTVCQRGTVEQRLPASGELTWDGAGVPHP